MISISTEIEIFNIGLCRWKALDCFMQYIVTTFNKKLELKISVTSLHWEDTSGTKHIMPFYRQTIMKTLLKQWDLPATYETQEKFFNRCFPHQTDTYPHWLQWSWKFITWFNDQHLFISPIKKKKKRTIAIGYSFYIAADKIYYGLKSLIVKLYYSIAMFMA